MAEKQSRIRFGDYVAQAEGMVYAILAILLVATSLATLAGAGKTLVAGLRPWPTGTQTLRVLDELLVVLMLVEILHTVRISMRAHMLAMTEPFLVVGLIATIRRILVITLEAATLGKQGEDAPETTERLFHSSMVELGLLGALVLIFASSIILLRRFAPATQDAREG